MKKRIAIVLAVVLLFTFVGSVGADGPFTWDTGFQVQNLGTATANITITYYRDDGSVAHTVSDTIPPGESKTYYQPSIPELGTTFDGSVVITSDQPIAAIANQTSYSQEPNLAASYNGVEGAGTATTVMAPIIFKNYNNWTTRLAVQNAGSATTNVTVTYRRGADTWTEGPVAIPPGARHTFDQKDSPIPDNFLGSAVVSSDGQPLAVVVNEINPTGIALSYTGFSTGATKITAPLLFKSYNNWNTGLQVQNVGTATANVTVTYYWDGGSCTENATIEPNAAYTFYQPNTTCMPDGVIASAVVESDQPVVAIVNEVNYARGTGMSYNTIDVAAGTTTVSAPLLFKNYNNWVTGLQVQNVGTATANVTVTYYGAGGPWTETATIEPGASANFYQPSGPMPDGFIGSAVVTSDQPVVAVVNETNYARTGDAAMSYTGINQ